MDGYCPYQTLSKEFIANNSDNLYLSVIYYYQKAASYNIIDRLIYGSAKNWLHKSPKFLKKKVKALNLYECHEDYFIAFKGIRSDRYSKFNFQYQYFEGGTYESNCDCDINRPHSFGLSAWTKKMAREYCDELVIKVKIRYEDVGAIMQNTGKIRCRRSTVLS